LDERELALVEILKRKLVPDREGLAINLVDIVLVLILDREIIAPGKHPLFHHVAH
jgi:hypothetical protein